ncbi:CDP-alcohol phosphatidyltransferase family protein [Clostridium coskatii]|uniref:CDP-diacylglycerol--glycerol-3-phosphate 3-phosphatidyltransferase n=1 Tax=Clostridium coskatii TaxID=1705578 RepID=A0A170NNE7_9CLOT|nr:CDP-alcohol phosphatidyltransferase family protein [Clostridium coskatii]OAA93288.1 hypothetical protein WX73_00240 [Clostridium coskatii]OBR95329.1 hypothetical protein CLCOS_16530 [Clostridium coskatii]
MIINSAANCISLLRIFLAIMMLFVRPLSELFFIIFLACQITDVLDGYVAKLLLE